jgi:hypothetical protein
MSDPLDPPYVYRPGFPRPSPRGVRSRLRDRGLERPNRPNGVKLSDGAVEAICKDAGAEYTRTPAGRLWVTAWAVAVIGSLEGYRRAERIRALVHFKAPEREELRAAVVALWRMKRLDAVRETVEHAGFGAGADRLPVVQP